MTTRPGAPANILAKIRGAAAVAAVTINAAGGLIFGKKTGNRPL
jgi:hypothetical protein